MPKDPDRRISEFARSCVLPPGVVPDTAEALHRARLESIRSERAKCERHGAFKSPRRRNALPRNAAAELRTHLARVYGNFAGQRTSRRKVMPVRSIDPLGPIMMRRIMCARRWRWRFAGGVRFFEGRVIAIRRDDAGGSWSGGGEGGRVASSVCRTLFRASGILPRFGDGRLGPSAQAARLVVRARRPASVAGRSVGLPTRDVRADDA